ncbi:MAG: hypothetical protein ACKV2Q_32330 [Planctomycetaceae bacterium]
MKTINLQDQQPSLAELLQVARNEPVLLVEPTGGEFVLSAADDFDAEVAALRASPPFQAFLDQRSHQTRTRPFSDYVRELDAELNRESLGRKPSATEV